MTIAAIPRCPEREPSESEQNWFSLSQSPAFVCCSRCWTDHISRTQFANNFVHTHDASGTARLCQFNRPAVRNAFAQATQTGNLAPFTDYVARRLQIPSCRGGGVGVSPELGFQWFMPKDPNLHGKICICTECYDDYVAPAGLQNHLSESPVAQAAGQEWGCDMGWDFCRRFMASTRDWATTTSWALYIQNLPACATAAGAKGSSRKWHKLRNPNVELWACESCYYNVAGQTVAAQHFEPTAVPGPDANWVCFVGGSVPLRVALDEAIRRNDWGLFHKGALAYVCNPICSGEGIQNGTWYSLVPASPEVDICATCFTCIFESMDMGHILAPKSVSPGEVRLCNMNLATPHMQVLCKKLDLAIARQDPTLFTTFTRNIAGVPLCPGGTPVEGRKWYAHDLFLCCPACWFTAPIQGTALASCFSDGVTASNKIKCDFYSVRVRELWRKSCETNDLAGFSAFMKKRLDVWAQTYPLIQQQLSIMRMNAQRQQTLYMASILNTGGNNIATAAGAHGNFGNNAIGYGYETYAGAQGAMQFNQALSMTGSNLGPVAQITQLENLWKSVE